MLTEYVQAAMRKAHNEILEDDNSFYGEIPGFDGVWATADTLEGCREELDRLTAPTCGPAPGSLSCWLRLAHW